MARVHLVVIKYTFFAVLIFSAGLLIERFTKVTRFWKVDSVVSEDLVYNASSPLQSRSYEKVLKKRYLRCLTEPTKPFCLLSANKRLEVFRSKGEQEPNVEEVENRLRNITSGFPSSNRIHTMLVEFTKVMKSYRVNVILIEPSMLFCLLSSAAKFSMLSKGFNPGRILGSRNVVSVGILDADSKILESKNLTNEILSAGFKIIKFRKWIGDESQKDFETAHYFFVMENVAIHVVVLYARNDFMWHAGLDPKEIDFEGLLFVNEEIYENFTLLPLNLAGTSISRLFLPHDIRQFMREIEGSKIIECSTNASGIAVNVEHPKLTREQLITRVVIVLKELKAIFSPYATFFWLWSKSLLGWFVECDVFHFSSSLDLALLFKDIQPLNLTDILADNEFLSTENSTESNRKYGYKIDCHGLSVNVNFIHEDRGFVWRKPGDTKDFEYKYSTLSLCSSELYGQKIQVPCNVTDVLEVEFARNITRNNLTII